MVKAAKKWAEERYLGGELRVFVYSMRSGPMAAACAVKKLIPEAKLFLIVTDLPQFMDMGESRMKAMLKKADRMSIDSMLKKMDGFILYTRPMAKELGIEDGKWLLMEGSYDGNTSEINREHSTKAVMYSGKLDINYGIPMLVDAFMKTEDPSYELWFTGEGYAEKYIRECAEKDPRIKFYGFLPSREDVLKLQSEAALLVNMRLPSEPVSDFSFPSKIFEYMASGVPVLSFKLGGIPEEYFGYMVTVDSEDEESLKTAIENALSDPNLEEMGKRASEFIKTEKNKIKQCGRILAFAEGIDHN